MILLWPIVALIFMQVIESQQDVSPEDFASIRHSTWFLDKTMFIKEFIEKSENHIALIGPRQFGKSSLMDMFFKFVEKRVSENGTERDSSKIRDLFRDTNIEKNDTAFFNKHFNQYPVIKFNFAKITYQSHTDFQATFIKMIRNEFRRHKYLLSSDKLNELDKEEFRYYCKEVSSNEPNVGLFITAGETLSELLRRHFEKRVILLVDEYDSFQSELMAKRFIERDAQLSDMLETMGRFVCSLIKGNDENLEMSLLTGVTSMGTVFKEHANNLEVFSVFDTLEYSRYYGISETELTKLTKNTVREKDIDLVRYWYCGYYVKGTKERLYNMYSVIKFLQTGKINLYWEGKASLSTIWGLFEPDKYGRVIEETMSRGNTIHLERIVITQKLLALRNINTAKSPRPFELSENEHLFLQYLTENGFFTIDYSRSIKPFDFCGKIKVPNTEIRLQLDCLVYTNNFLQSVYALDDPSINGYLTAVNNLSDEKKSVLKLVNAVENLFSKVEIASESSFHAIMYAVFVANRAKFDRIEVVARMQCDDTASVVTDLRVRRKDGTEIVIKFNYKNQSSRAAIEQVLKQKSYDFKTKKKILLGLHLSEHKKCTVSYLWGSTNASDIRDVPEARVR